jgi:inner membrane transporter RhtA
MTTPLSTVQDIPVSVATVNRPRTIPPTALVMLSMLSVQLGAALAKQLFAEIGPGGTVFLRSAIGALILLLAWRPKLKTYTRHDFGMAALLGCSIAGMNLLFYSAVARLPLGICVTIEFLGPLGLSIILSRRWRDVLWVILAGSGVVLLSPLGGVDLNLDPVGVLFAATAGIFWAIYIVLNRRIGKRFSNGAGVALALCASSTLLLPFGIANAGTLFSNPVLLIIAFGMALLSSIIPFSLDFAALRNLPPRVFGILTSLEGGIAALVGAIFLGELLNIRELVAIVLVIIAAAGASREPQRE